MLREITHLTTCVLQQTLQRALNGVDHRTSSSQLLYTFGSPLSRPRFSSNRQATVKLTHYYCRYFPYRAAVSTNLSHLSKGTNDDLSNDLK